jgi:ubiquinone/menaquinone biosynthesis C-methylase UbiE
MWRLLLISVLIPTLALAQKKDKVEKLSFCGWRMNDKEKAREYLQSQFDFLNVQEGDTIVDIGAASGSFEGVFLSVSDFEDVSFILVDINPGCLNQQKVNNMLAHYSKLKGDSIKNTFQLVQNTPDSLWLPLNRFQKVWMLNTLHEIPDQEKMIRDIYAVLKPGGEVTILENPPKREGQLHGGCHKPLLSFEKMNALFTSGGFQLDGRKDIIRKRSSDVLMLRFIKP